MKQTNIIIIDDEQAARQNLRKIAEQFCEGYKVVAEAESALEGIKLIQKHKPDIVLLDIEMPGGSGFDMLDIIQNEHIQVIFITAYNQYAIKAFKYNTIDYLLKPVDIDELATALEKASKKSKYEDLKPIVEDIRHKNPLRLAISTQNETEYVPISSIIRMQADGSYTTIFLDDSRSFIVSRNLKSFEDTLEEEHFLRVHNSHLINLMHVTKYIKKDGYIAITSDGTSVPIATRRKDTFEELIKRISK